MIISVGGILNANLIVMIESSYRWSVWNMHDHYDFDEVFLYRTNFPFRSQIAKMTSCGD